MYVCMHACMYVCMHMYVLHSSHTCQVALAACGSAASSGGAAVVQAAAAWLMDNAA